MRFQHVMASVLASAAAFWLPPASAGSFGLSPLRLDLSGQAATASVNVRNNDSSPALVQAEAVVWSQVDGEDRLEPTTDLIVSPTVFTLPADGSQLVRVALRGAAEASRELSYRLILQEVPAEASPDFKGLRVALRLSVPIFVAPNSGKAEPNLEFSATRNADGALVLRADNKGNGHGRVLSFSLTPTNGHGPVLQDSVASYVLPGQYRTWTIKNNESTRDDSTAQADRYRLKATTERGEVVTELAVTR
jgi:fimbrial chaperone protein